MYSVHVCVCVCVRGGEVRNDERKKGKGESCVEMRWRRKMMKGSLVKLWLDGWCWHAIRKLQPIIPDSQGQVSSDKLNYRVSFIIKHLTPFSWTFTVFFYFLVSCIYCFFST